MTLLYLLYIGYLWMSTLLQTCLEYCFTFYGWRFFYSRKLTNQRLRYLTWKRLSRFSPWHQKIILLFTFIKQTRKSPERVYTCYGYMCKLHSDLCSIWQEARQHMAQAAGELHVSGVAVLEDKPGFPSCHVQSLGSASAFTVPEIRCIRQCCSAARPHRFAPSLYRKTPPPNQLKACIPLRLHVLQTQ